jgi:hypothetical protein
MTTSSSSTPTTPMAGWTSTSICYYLLLGRRHAKDVYFSFFSQLRLFHMGHMPVVFAMDEAMVMCEPHGGAVIG